MKFATKRERHKQGKALREKCPRAAHAEWKPRSKSKDIVKLLEESDVDRIPGLIAVKYQRMGVSPFTFFRGAAIIQARDLANSPVSGMGFRHAAIVIWRTLVALPLPNECWFSTSMTSMKPFLGRERMSEFAEMKVLDTWYATISIDDLKERFQKDPDMSTRLSKKQKQARSRNSEAVVPKLTAVVDGRRCIKDDPPVLYHFHHYAHNFQKGHAKFLGDYKKSLPIDKQRLFDRYRFEDSAIKVVGVGSVGTRCYLGLFLADEDDPLFLQVKEARRSVLEKPGGRSLYAHQGFRVVEGIRVMQGTTDIFLGYGRTQNHDYYLRQFRDMKVSAEVEIFRPSTLVSYADMCGWALARAHAKAGDAAMIAGYLGSSDQIDDSLVQYSEAYADQAEDDYEAFRKAIGSGRLSTEPAKEAGLEFLL